MTFVIPNHFIEEEPDKVVSSDPLFTVLYSSRHNSSNMAIRNVMHVMILLLEGTKKVHFSNHETCLKAGSLLLLTQGNYFMSEVLNGSKRYESILVCFDDEFVMEFIKKHQLSFEGMEPSEVVPFSVEGILKVLVESLKYYTDHEVSYLNEIIKLKTEEIFLHLLSEKPKQFLSFLKAILQSSSERTHYILEANLDLIDSVEDMAKLLHLSKSELRKVMLKSFGMQPKEWLDKKRLEQAALLLKTTNDPISLIATSMGYGSASWFGVQFKKAYHLSPKAYREQNL